MNSSRQLEKTFNITHVRRDTEEGVEITTTSEPFQIKSFLSHLSNNGLVEDLIDITRREHEIQMKRLIEGMNLFNLIWQKKIELKRNNQEDKEVVIYMDRDKLEYINSYFRHRESWKSSYDDTILGYPVILTIHNHFRIVEL
jgi:hypothetical protein